MIYRSSMLGLAMVGLSIAWGAPLGNKGMRTLGAEHEVAASDATALASYTPPAGTVCNQIPDGKKLGMFVVWVNFAAQSNANIDEEAANTMMCEAYLPLLTARASLAAPGMCFKESDIEMVMLTNTSSLATNVRKKMEAAGVKVRDVAHEDWSEAYQQQMLEDAAEDAAASGDEEKDPVKLVSHMFKLAPLWMEEYAVTLTLDTDLFIEPMQHRVQSIDLYNKMLEPAAPQILYHHGCLSPLNAGLFAAKPTAKAKSLFMQGIKYGFDQVNGWGGGEVKYDATILAKAAQFSHDHEKEREGVGKSLGPVCKKGADWCFIGAVQDQGMMMHILSALGADNKVQVTSFDSNSLPGFEFDYHHQAYKPKPWALSSVFDMAKETKHGKLESHYDERLADFWAMYRMYLRKHWDKASPKNAQVCKRTYANLYQELLSSGVTENMQLSRANKMFSDDLTFYKADRQLA
jgi:hypothetical protein